MVNDGFFHYQLSSYQKLNALVSLFIDPENPDDFIAGFVAQVNMRQVVLTSVSPVGRYDGLMAVKLSEINTVMGEDDYAERLRRLLDLRGEAPRDTLAPDDTGDLFHALLKKALDEKRVITAWCGNDEYVGYVSDVNDMRVTLSALDFFGQDPQEETLTLREIDMISFGAEDELMYELLSARPVPEA